MRILPGKPSRRIAVLTAAAALTCGTALTAAAPAGASAGACVNLDNLTSTQTALDYHQVTPGTTSVGDWGKFTDQLTDPTGAVVGTRVGYAVILYQASNGDFYAGYSATVSAAGGTLAATGVIDVVTSGSGAWWSIPAVGLSGATAGMTGTVASQSTSPTTDNVKIDVCPAG